VAAGRLADAKNYPLLIDALAELRRTVPARLFILGEGEGEAVVRGQIARLGLDADVVLCGFQRNPWKYIARADVFALSSRYEGFGNVLVEAMACGVPVVATSSPGTCEIVGDGIDGLLVEHHEPAAGRDGARATAERRRSAKTHVAGRAAHGQAVRAARGRCGLRQSLSGGVGVSAALSGLEGRSWAAATVVGVLVGAAYVLSPLTVLSVLAAAAIVMWAGRGLPGYERRWVHVLLITAIVLRILAVAALFVASESRRRAIRDAFRR